MRGESGGAGTYSDRAPSAADRPPSVAGPTPSGADRPGRAPNSAVGVRDPFTERPDDESTPVALAANPFGAPVHGSLPPQWNSSGTPTDTPFSLSDRTSSTRRSTPPAADLGAARIGQVGTDPRSTAAHPVEERPPHPHPRVRSTAPAETSTRP